MLNLHHAKTFLTVLDERGFRAAARKLALSPSTILEHVQQLEAELSAPLLTRLRGGVLPTRHGELFLPLARALVETAERATALLANATLRLAASSNTGVYLLQPLLKSFQLKHGVAVEQWIGSNPNTMERLTRGLADVAIMEWWDGRTGFSARTWRKEPLVVIVAPGHPLASKERLDVRDLTGWQILGGEKGTGTGTLLEKVLGPEAAGLKAVEGLGSTEAVKYAVRAGSGISLVMEAAVRDEVAAGTLVALRLANAKVEKALKVILPAAQPDTAPAALFVAHLLSDAQRRSVPEPAEA